MTAILWSGGTDSTLLLHDLATKAKQDGHNINAYTIHHPQIPNSHLEQHQKQTLKQLSWIGLNNINHHHITINTTLDIQQNGIPQAAIWIGTIPPYLAITENLNIAYIKEDDIWHYRNYIHDAFNNLQILLGHTGTLTTPYEWTPKHEILQRIKQLKLTTWTCETTPKTLTHKPCNHCQPCKKQRTAQYTLTHIHKEHKNPPPTTHPLTNPELGHGRKHKKKP